jgi:PAS domain S-box-containing protein
LGGRGFSGVVWKDRLGGLSLVLEGLASSFGVALHRMREARAVRRRQESLRALFDAVPESMFLMDLEGMILEANLGFAMRFGKKVEEVVGRNVMDLLPRHLIEVRRAWMAEVVRTLRPVIREELWGERWLRHHSCPLIGLNRQLEGIVVLAVDITEHRLLEEALRRSQQLAEGVFNSVEGQIAVVDETGRILSVNAAWERFHGGLEDWQQPSEAGRQVGANYLEIWKHGLGDGSAEGRMAREGVRAVMEGRRDFFSVEYPCHTHDERRWFQLTVTPLGQEGGGAVIVHTNITGRKLAEEEVRQRLELQDQLAKVAASVPGLIYSFRLGTDGVLSMPFANGTLRDLFGLEPELVRDDFSPGLELVHPDDKERLLRSVELSARRLTPWHEVLRVLLPGRGELWLEGHSVPRRESDGSVIWHGFIQDITERKRAEQVLAAEVTRRRMLIEGSRDGIVVLDASGGVYEASQRFADMLGYTMEEVKELRVWDWDRNWTQERVVRAIEAMGPEGNFLETRHWRKDGSSYAVEVSNSLAVVDGQRLVFCVCRDVTARLHLEAQYRQVQKLEAVGHLAGGVAHDFNNILAAILMNFELLREDASLGPEARENLLELEKEARRAAGVTRQLLMFSRRSVLDVRVVNMNEVVGDILKMLRRLLGEHVELEFVPDPNLPAVEADPGMLEQVVLNLAVNARDAMPRGGRISMVTRGERVSEERAAHNPDSRPGWFACLSMTDTGCGMDAETMGKIFEPFFTTKEAFRGTGLGLATVHGIVGQHKGWVEVESAPGQGTEFRVYFPAVQHPTPVDRSRPSPEISEYRGQETLLLVEDEPSVRRSLCQILGILGYTVLEAADSRQALEIWKTKGDGVSLLFTDMVMPGPMNGLELAEHLLGERPDLRVIISSGYSDAITREGMPDNPRIVYLSKPYDLQSLGSCLRRCLG